MKYLIASILTTTIMIATEIELPKQGHFRDWKTFDECIWTSEVHNNSKFFSDLNDSTVYFHFINDAFCLKDTKFNRQTIAGIISEYYIGTKYVRETKLMTNPDDWVKSAFQKRGKCIISKNFSSPAIWISFKTENQFIIAVAHQDGVYEKPRSKQSASR